MGRATKFRYLSPAERTIAHPVFKDTVPYGEVVISDGIGANNRPFTMPRNAITGMGLLVGLIPALVANKLFEAPYGKYVIHAGELGYAGMATIPEQQQTLVHELAHVWQGEHSSHTWHYVFSSMWHQYHLGSAAYKYDPAQFKDWDDYNPEQQAKIVQDWFARGMMEDETQDGRYLYIWKHIRGDREKLKGVTPRLESGTLHVPVTEPSYDYLLLSLLEPRFAVNDVAGFGGRVIKLQEFFRRLDPANSGKLHQRLGARRPGDKVSELFHHRLSHASQATLMGILRDGASRN